MKFAMIPINRRYNDKNQRVVRRVLISYTSKRNGIYKGSKIIELDPYFKNENSSHQYLFEDDGFRLVHDEYGDNYLLEVKRPYQYHEGSLYEPSIEFMAKDLQEAIEMFNNRVEVH